MDWTIYEVRPVWRRVAKAGMVAVVLFPMLSLYWSTVIGGVYLVVLWLFLYVDIRCFMRADLATTLRVGHWAGAGFAAKYIEYRMRRQRLSNRTSCGCVRSPQTRLIYPCSAHRQYTR